MELAALDDMPEAFDAYARELANAAARPWLRAHYLLFLGEGMNRLGRRDASEEALNEAISFAEANQIHQVSFKAQSALSAIRTAARPTQALRCASYVGARGGQYRGSRNVRTAQDGGGCHVKSYGQPPVRFWFLPCRSRSRS